MPTKIRTPITALRHALEQRDRSSLKNKPAVGLIIIHLPISLSWACLAAMIPFTRGRSSRYRRLVPFSSSTVGRPLPVDSWGQHWTRSSERTGSPVCWARATAVDVFPVQVGPKIRRRSISFLRYLEYKLIFGLEKCTTRGGYIASSRFLIEEQLALPSPQRAICFSTKCGAWLSPWKQFITNEGTLKSNKAD